MKCRLRVPQGTGQTGGRLTGGFGSSSTLWSGEDLEVEIEWGDTSNPAPPVLRGRFIVSPGPSAPGQTKPSPFRQSNGKFECYWTGSGNEVGGKYGMTAKRYKGGLVGFYELAVAVLDPGSGAEWSRDPEFDTGD